MGLKKPDWKDPYTYPHEIGKVHPVHAPPNPMNLSIHLNALRHRTAGMNPEERAWRRKWIKNQNLSDIEPLTTFQSTKHVNPIRKIVRLPGDVLERTVMSRMFGWYWANFLRRSCNHAAWLFGIAYFTYYYRKYRGNDWQSAYGMHFMNIAMGVGRDAYIRKTHPGLIEKAFYLPTKPEDYFGYGIEDRQALIWPENPPPPDRP